MSGREIEGSVAFVSGANRGIGKAIAEALLDRGVEKVYAGARRLDSLTPLVERYGSRVEPVELDITDSAQVRAAAELATDVNILVNNAGVAGHGGSEFTEGAWLGAGQDEFRVNALGTFEVTQRFAPTLGANGGGTVVNIVSVAGLVNFPLFLSYSLSKAALHNLTQGTRVSLAAQGTQVIGVYPGPVDTDMAAEVPFEKVSPASVAAEILDAVEAGTEEVFPDPMSKQFGEVYARNPKELERQIAEMAAEGAPA